MKYLKLIGLSIVSLCVVGLIYVVSMIAYAWFTDYLPKKKESQKITKALLDKAELGDTLTMATWNLGYAGLGEDEDFFYSGGQTVTPLKEKVEENLKGLKNSISNHFKNTDFLLFQEIDIEAKRSHFINQYELIKGWLSDHASSFALNYDVNFVPIPISDPMGKVNAGLSTFSKFNPIESIRNSFEGNYSFPKYLFLLDRCFLLNRYQIKEDKELVVINTHNSAYDGGILKKKQLKQLKHVMQEEYAKGNYVIVGGDWNQSPKSLLQDSFAMELPLEEWGLAYDEGSRTCRSTVEEYKGPSTETYLIDYFAVSPNIEVLSAETLDLDFKNSDHDFAEEYHIILFQNVLVLKLVVT